MHKKNRRPLLAVLVFLLVLLGLFVYKTRDFYPVLLNLIFERNVSLKQENNNINVLLLGIGGGNHDGPNLTDTIILASLNQKDKKVVLTSIPRDLWVPELSGSNKKINNAYAFGEEKRKGGGIPLAKAIVSKVTGQTIDYAVRIDFSGFVKAVDIIGGLDVNVENTFDDYFYPLSGKEDDTCGYSDDDISEFLATVSAEADIQQKFGCRYLHLHFDKGLDHMNGETALEYVRSRHALGIEGTDFARSKRQEKIISAFKDKLFSAQTLVNPVKILTLYDVIKQSIDTDIKQNEFDDFVRLAQDMKNAKISSAIIDTGDDSSGRDGLLVNPVISKEYNYEWVLIPKAGEENYTELKSYISCQIKSTDCPISAKSNP